MRKIMSFMARSIALFANGASAGGAIKSAFPSARLAVRASAYDRWTHRDSRRRLSGDHPRSEEHTSELQSLMRISYAVFCLKKKKHYTTRNRDNYPVTPHQNNQFKKYI